MSDTNRSALTARVTEIAERIGDREGMEIVEAHVLGGGKARVVRVYIDKPGGVTHADCQLMSDRLGEVFDAEDVIPGEEGYTLEVSSPGVERKLSKPRDFERFTGQKAKIVLREPVENQRHWEGTLTGFDHGLISLEAASGQKVRIPIAHVKNANLKFEW